MSLHKSLTASEVTEVTAVNDPDQLWNLAQDYERWGLAPEAELARVRSRQIVVRNLLEGSRPRVRPDGKRVPRTAS